MASPNNNYLGTSDSEDEEEFEDLTTLDRKLILTQDLDNSNSSNLIQKEEKIENVLNDHLQENESEVDEINEKSLFGEESDEELPGLFGEDEQDAQEKTSDSLNKVSEPSISLEEVNYTQIASLPSDAKVSLMERPSILFMDPRPFDPDIYEIVDPEKEEDHQLRMKVENTIRWRYVQGVNGQLEVQSNARLIEWSNGSRSLLVGDELLDWMMAPTPPYQSLVSIHHEDNVLITQTPLHEKIMIKPYGVSNKTHQKMASMLSKKYKRQQKTKVIDVDKNLELERQQQILAEQECLKAQRKLEAKKKSLKNKYATNEFHHDYDLEEDDDTENMDRKSRDHRLQARYEPTHQKKKGKSRVDSFSDEDEDDDDDEEEDLNDFIVDDDLEDEPIRYTEEDELEELERAEQLLSARREAGNEVFDRQSKHGNPAKQGSNMPSFQSQRANLVTITDDEEEDVDMLDLDEEMALRKGKKRAVFSDDEDEETHKNEMSD